MLAELAIANACFATIKEAVQHSGDLLSAGDALFKFFDEAFMALEQIRKNEEELKQMMIYQGRAGLWTDWLKFQLEAKKKREAAERERVLKRQRLIGRIKDVFMIILVIVLLGGLGLIIGAAVWLARDK
jgi:hypothetical protein